MAAEPIGGSASLLGRLRPERPTIRGLGCRSGSLKALPPVTYEQERLLRQVILEFVRAVDDRGSSLPKIKLVKLLYLVDFEAWKRRGIVSTGLEWSFYHYGPYTTTLEPVLERAEGQYFNRVELPREQSRHLQMKAAQLGNAQVPLESEVVYLYRPIPFLADEPIEDLFVAELVSTVAARWAAATTDEILEHVYATPPIARGVRYRLIDWNLAERGAALFGSKARYFQISDATRAEIDNVWNTWRRTGRDGWTAAYEPEERFFDDVFAAAMARMDDDEGADAIYDVRIVGALPQRHGADD